MVSGSVAGPLDARLARQFEVDPETGCWLWTAYCDRHGYGKVTMPNGRKGGVRLLAHRVVYENFVEHIPEGLTIDHLCRVPNCVNPDHMEPVTPRVNSIRAKAAQTECKRGHAFDENNTYINPDGARVCRTCVRLRAAANRARKAAAA